MKSDMFGELLQKNKELEEQFIRLNDSAMQLLEIDKEHQKINGELREENKKLKKVIRIFKELLKSKRLEYKRTIPLNEDFYLAYGNVLGLLDELLEREQLND